MSGTPKFSESKAGQKALDAGRDAIGKRGTTQELSEFLGQTKAPAPAPTSRARPEAKPRKKANGHAVIGGKRA